MNRSLISFAVLLGSTFTAACSDSDPEAAGEGSAQFTTWGEEYIEQEIPVDSTAVTGFIDGWTVKYDTFLVSFEGLSVKDHQGEVGALHPGQLFVDNHVAGKKELVTFAGLEAKHWDEVAYAIAPARAGAEIVAGEAADLDRLVTGGYSIYVSGTATKGSVTKTFHWGFDTDTLYTQCKAVVDGKETLGTVVTRGGTDVIELTTHGDHFFYDRLQASPDPAIETSLRFDEKAAADTGDGEITLEELDAVAIDPTRYDPSGFEVSTYGGFIRALARTIGHFKGEGECEIEARH